MSLVKIDQWGNWRRCLENKTQPGKHELGVLSLNEPWSGYWRTGLAPLAIWRDEDGNLRCVKGGGRYGERRNADALKEWPFARDPITYEEYTSVCGGAVWSDIDESVSDLVETKPWIGHNFPPADDPAEALKEKIERALEGVEKYNRIDDDEACARAQTLRDFLNKCATEGENAHKQEKAPWLEKAKAVDSRWLPKVKVAREAAVTIRRAMENWIDEKARRRRAAEAAERKRQEEEQAHMDVAVTPPAPPGAAPSAEPMIRGATGKGTTPKEKPTAVVTDWMALAEHFIADAAVQQVLLKLAQAAVDVGVTPPGVTIELRARIR